MEYSLDTCLHRLIESQTDQTPDAEALRFNGQTLSYAELNRRANQCAHYLREVGAGPDKIIAVLMERSTEMSIALLAILKAGGAYLPIDPDYPADRIELLLEDAGVSIVLTQQKMATKISPFQGTVLFLDSEWDFLRTFPLSNPENRSKPDDLAYIIYTSGSTGKPKGCMISHKAICNRLLWMREEYHIGCEDRILQKTPYTFDVSIWEFFLPLLSGACLVVAKPNGHQDTAYLVEFIKAEAISVCHFVPSMLHFFLQQQGVETCTSLLQVFTSGEALTYDLGVKFDEKLSGKLHNLYGPTEAAVDVTYWEWHRRPDEKVPIGKPIANSQILILDSELRPVPTGESGTLYIGGVGLAKGYLNRPELTAEKFISDPFSEDPYARLYNSGDNARYLEDGNIEYLGRADSQVKVRGFRIEPGEIEAALGQHPNIDRAVVLVQDSGTPDPKLVAYVVANAPLETKDIRQFARLGLPEYMVPNKVLFIDAIPVTRHGKVDTKSLQSTENRIEPQPIMAETTQKISVNEPTTLHAALLQTVRSIIGSDKLGYHDDLFDAGATSFTIIRIIDRIQDEHNVSIPLTVFMDLPTVFAIGNFLSENNDIAAHDSKHIPSFEELTACFEAMLHVTGIRETDDLFDLGATSFTIMQLVDSLQERYTVTIPIEVFLDDSTAGAITGKIRQLLADKPGNSTAALRPVTFGKCITPQPESSENLKLVDVQFGEMFYHGAKRFSTTENSLSLAQFGRFLSLLRMEQTEEKARYLYASAGGLNPVQTYVYVKEKGVDGLPEGVYYYHPVSNQLCLIQDQAGKELKTVFFAYDQPYFEAARFVLFLISRQEAIRPVYSTLSPSLSLLEAGYMGQLLESRQQAFNLELLPANGVDFQQIRHLFDLEEDHRFLHCLVGGLPHELSAASALNPDNMSRLEYISQTGETLHGHCSGYTGDQTFPAFLQVKNDAFSLPSRETVEASHMQHLNIREIKPEMRVIELEKAAVFPTAYQLRSAKRTYSDSPVPFAQLSRFLGLLSQRVTDEGPQYLYPSVTGDHGLKHYVFIKENGVENVEPGIYRYDPVHHHLVHINTHLSTEIKNCYTPFNRAHADAAKFCLFIVAPLERLESTYGDDATYLALLEAGYIGQLLLDRQAEFEIGVCPIGELRFAKIRADFKLAPTDELLHSFVCGNHILELPEHYTFLEPGRQKLTAMSIQQPENNRKQQDLAIIGMSGRYPDAANLEIFRQNLQDGKSSFRSVSASRLAQYGKPADFQAAFLDAIDCFDSGLFNITPVDAKSIDPQERLLLEAVWECLENAGYTSEGLNISAKKTGVFIGVMWDDYQHYASTGTPNGRPVLATSHHSSIANRISYSFNFTGPSIAVNTSCSSALSALHAAANAIKNGECDAAIVGGVNLLSHPYHYETLEQLELVSKTGSCHPFGKESDGWMPGEGVGAILLKPLSNAEQQRDFIHGVVKGTATGHTGKSMRFGAPDSRKQMESMQEAIKNADVPLSSISYVEAAAPGASLADASEMAAIKELFNNSNSEVYIGSLKANIGHLEAASGMSQLMKVLLQMQQQQLYPTLNIGTINPLIRLNDTRLELVETHRKWDDSAETPFAPKRALINAFGATGSCGHAVLQSYTPAQRRNDGTPCLILLSAASTRQLAESAQRLHDYLTASGEALSLTDVAYTLQSGRREMDERLAIITSSSAEACELLARYIDGATNVPHLFTGSLSNEVVYAAIPEETELESIAQQWVSGASYKWNNPENTTARRIPLPTYPFAKEQHWVHTPASAVTEPVQPTNYAEATTSITTHTNTADNNLTKEVQHYLKRIVSEKSGIPVSRITTNGTFDDFGISSQLIKQLNLRLETDFGPLSQTLFFEFQTIQRLANYFVTEHADKIRELLPHTANTAFAEQPFDRPEELTGMRKKTTCLNSDERIAIIGLSGRYPKSPTIAAFWENLKQGVDCISEIPDERWNHSDYFSDDRAATGKTYAKWGGFIDGHDMFDPLFFNIAPHDARGMDPQERVFLETAWHTIEDAGYNRQSYKKAFGNKVGVFVGVMYNEYLLYSAARNGNGAALTSSIGSIANRVSYQLGFSGPSMGIDTMCSSSLTALHLAVNSIKNGDCEAAIVGGVNLALHPNKYILHAQLNMSSSDGRCRSFGEGGDGFVPGEGVGAVLLKPLSQALKDGDQIYATIRGTAINHDGKTHGYTVPNPNAQAEMIAQALQAANVEPACISYVEAHGTGTSLGDPIEMTSLTKAFGPAANGRQFCSIGSVKSNIGHLEAAAGIAGLTKILLQMKHKTLVPSLHSDHLNAGIDFEKTPFYVQQTLKKWENPRMEIDGEIREIPRMACISGFGAGGANAHAILEEYTDEIPVSSTTGNELIVPLSAKNEERLIIVASHLLQFIRSQSGETATKHAVPEEAEKAVHAILNGQSLHINGHSATAVLDKTATTGIASNRLTTETSPLRLADLAYTLQVGREPMGTRLALVVQSVEELADKLERFVRNDRDPAVFHFGKVPKNAEGLLKYMDDEDLIRMTEAWVFKKKYAELMDLWVKGLEIDWQRFQNGLHPKRISLPTYPFARDRYWVAGTDSISEAPPINGESEKVSQLFLKPVWQEQTIPADRKTPAYTHRHVFFCDIYRMDKAVWPQSPEITYHQLESAESMPEKRFADHAAALFETVKSILHSSVKDGVLLQVIIPDSSDDTHLAGLSALLKTVNRENPAVYGQLIASDDVLLPAQLEAECFQFQTNEVCYRDGQRFVRRLQELTPSIHKKVLPWKNKGVYLISGGTGGLGLLFAREIAAQTTGATLILTGRSALTKERESAIRSLADLGIQVCYKSVDVQDELQVNTLIETILSEYGSLNGVLHCAGITKDQYIFNKNIAEFREVLAPKVAGTVYLDESTKAIDLDFFVSFSSSIAVTGNAGQADYACANAFMDAFAAHRSTRRNGRTLSINWPFWQNGGMATDAAGEEVMRAQWGMLPMNTAPGIAAFYTAMASAEEQVIVINGIRTKMQQVFLSEPVKTTTIIETSDGHPNTAKGTLKQQLKTLFSEISTIPVHAIDAEENWENYGVDSIMITRLNRKLEAIFGEISKTLFYEYQSLNALSEYLAGNYAQQCSTWIGSAMETMVHETQPGEATRPVMADHVAARPAITNESAGAYREPIAIIGLNGTFPQAKNLNEYWKNLESGKDCIVEIPQDRWSLDGFFNPSKKEAVANGISYSKWGGFIDEFAAFDPLFFNISPHDALNIDPQERIFLQSCWKLIEDAGYTKDRLAKQHRSNVGVFAGVTQTGFELYGPELRKRGEYVFPRTSFSSVANRVSFALNLNGPSMPVDTMCSSSLTAIHEACRHLDMGECEMAIAGAVNLYLHPFAYAGLCSQYMLSVDGKCKSFGQQGNGFVPGEGVGVVLLKKLSDAIRDNDQIHGIIRGTGVNHGGRANGYTVPSPKAQGDLIRETLDRAGINARTVSYIEAHGTGTELGDPIEITGLAQAFEKDTSDKGFCAIGSVKSNHGHLEAAAGMAGLTKVLLQMKHGKLVPSLHASELNPNIPFSKTPFTVQQELTEWKRPVITVNGEEQEFPRIAGISSFGAGGANAHIIVEEYRTAEPQQTISAHTTPVIIVLSAKKEDRLKEYAENLLQFVQHQATEIDMEALSYTLQVGREAMDVRLGMIASSGNDLLEKLRAFVDGTPERAPFHFHKVDASKEAMAALADDEDMAKIVTTWIENRKYDKILEYWIKGVPFDWNTLYGTSKPPVISAPTYPFANEAYWLSISETEIAPRIIRETPQEKAAEAPLRQEQKTLQLSENWVLTPTDATAIDWNALLQVKKTHSILVISDENEPVEEIRKVCNAIAGIAGQQSALGEVQQLPFTSNETALRDYLAGTKNPLAIFVFLPELNKYTAEQELEAVYNCIRSLLLATHPETIQCYCCYEQHDTEQTIFREGLSGLLKSAMLESKGHTFRSIAYDAPFLQNGGLALSVIREWLCDTTTGANPRSIPMIRYESAQRTELQLSVGRQEQTRAPVVAFRNDGTYLMIGAIGDVGTFICQELGSSYRAKLVIFSRRPESEVAAQLNSIRAAGATVIYRSVDILDPEAVKAAIEIVAAQGLTLNGVVHMARRVVDQPIIAKEYAEFSAVMAAKVAGTINIDSATADLPLDFFLMYSSMAAFGIKGSADYAYSTSFQNAFARMRNKLVRSGKRAGKTVAICWGQWERDGAVQPEQLPARIALMQQLGIGCLDQKSAVGAMNTCLGSDSDVVGYLAVHDEVKALQTIGLAEETPTKEAVVLRTIESMERQVLTKPQFIAFLKTLGTEDYTETIRQKVMQVIATLEAAEKMNSTSDVIPAPAPVNATAPITGPDVNNILERTLLCVEKVLKLTKEQLDISKPLQDYGLDSIRAMQLSITLENEFNISVQASWLIQHPSLDSLANQLANKMTAL